MNLQQRKIYHRTLFLRVSLKIKKKNEKNVKFQLQKNTNELGIFSSC